MHVSHCMRCNRADYQLNSSWSHVLWRRRQQLINKANRINCHFSNCNIYIRNYRHACRQRARRALHSFSALNVTQCRTCIDSIHAIMLGYCVVLRPIQFAHCIHTRRWVHRAEHQRLFAEMTRFTHCAECAGLKMKMPMEKNKSLITHIFNIQCCEWRVGIHFACNFKWAEETHAASAERFCVCNYYIIMNSEHRRTASIK